ncbi:MAG: hypothetical protein PF501_17355 [Salinisphaera sp.]|nr:hypothetical protein [Salinisphaera sp.]
MPLIVLLLAAALGGCATDAVRGPATPDLSALKPAQQALNKALAANAGDFAPRTVDASRRRITIARDIVYSAARQDRSLTASENDRVQKLVDAARLDARAALVETQAKAVQTKLAELQQPAGGSVNGAAKTSHSSNQALSNQNRGADSSALGLSAFGEQRNATGARQ